MHALDGWWMNGAGWRSPWMDWWMNGWGWSYDIFWVFVFPSSSLSVSLFFLLSCIVRCCACLLLSPLLFSSLLPTPLPLFESSSSRNINSLLLLLLQERSSKSSGLCRVCVCVCTKASSQKKDVNSDSLQSIFFCYSCLFVAFVASVVGLLSCVLFWVWVCSLYRNVVRNKVYELHLGLACSLAHNSGLLHCLARTRTRTRRVEVGWEIGVPAAGGGEGGAGNIERYGGCSWLVDIVHSLVDCERWKKMSGDARQWS